MLYFCRRPFGNGESVSEHNKALRGDAYKLLLGAVREKGLCRDKLPEMSYNSYGKPYFSSHPDFRFNISHSGEMAVCSVSSSENGVDIERIRKYPERVPKRAFSDRERQLLAQCSNAGSMFFRLWTLKESYVKALGIGVSYPLHTAEFIIENDRITSYVEGNYRFSQLLLGDSYVCSLCTKECGTNSTVRLENEKEISCYDL